MSKSTFVKFSAIALQAALLAGCNPAPSTPGESEQSANAQSTLEQQKIAELRVQLDKLKDQTQKVYDANAIKRLQRSFAYYMEEGLWDEVVDLFTPDASWEFARDGIYQGQDRIRAYLLAMNNGKQGLVEGQLNENLQLMPVITVAENGMSAKARWRTIMMLGELGGDALWGEGPLENEYIKQGGVWKIHKMHWYQSILVPYEGGWGRNEDYNKGIWVSDILPADFPPSSDDGVWPTTYLPPFSFPNPVGKYEGVAAQGGQE